MSGNKLASILVIVAFLTTALVGAVLVISQSHGAKFSDFWGTLEGNKVCVIAAVCGAFGWVMGRAYE